MVLQIQQTQTNSSSYPNSEPKWHSVYLWLGSLGEMGWDRLKTSARAMNSNKVWANPKLAKSTIEAGRTLMRLLDASLGDMEFYRSEASKVPTLQALQVSGTHLRVQPLQILSFLVSCYHWRRPVVLPMINVSPSSYQSKLAPLTFSPIQPVVHLSPINITIPARI